jgi:hypothetical protein
MANISSVNKGRKRNVPPSKLRSRRARAEPHDAGRTRKDRQHAPWARPEAISVYAALNAGGAHKLKADSVSKSSEDDQRGVLQ